jgi:hypothetical protein
MAMSETTHNDILEPASNCFSEGGLSETTMEQIAKASPLAFCDLVISGLRNSGNGE